MKKNRPADYWEKKEIERRKFLTLDWFTEDDRRCGGTIGSNKPEENTKEFAQWIKDTDR